MLRSIEENYRINTSEEKDPKDKTETLLKNEKLIDVTDDNFNSFEKRISKIFNDESIPREKRLKEIYNIFFNAFSNRQENKTKIIGETGQWIQSSLERMLMMNIPINQIANLGATMQYGEEIKEKNKIILNKEITSRTAGAIAVREYVDTEAKRDNRTLFLSNGTIDRIHAVDFIETKDPLEDDACFCQVKAGAISKEKIEEIHQAHQKYFDFLVSADKKTQEEIESMRQERLEGLEKIYEIHDKLSEYLEKNGFGKNNQEYGAKIKSFAEKEKVDINLVFFCLKELASPENRGIADDEMEAYVDFAEQKVIKNGDYADNYDLFKEGLLSLGLRDEIRSKIIAGGKVVSYIKLKPSKITKFDNTN